MWVLQKKKKNMVHPQELQIQSIKALIQNNLAIDRSVRLWEGSRHTQDFFAFKAIKSDNPL